MNEPPWLIEARRDIGVREIPGKGDSPIIQRWLHELKAWWSDDATPWCGVAMAHWMSRCGIAPPKKWYRAMAWADWGLQIRRPAVGCVVVARRATGGHVGLVVGAHSTGRLMVLGGNQGDAVSIAPMDVARVVSYRWPPDEVDGWPQLLNADLPRIAIRKGYNGREI